MLQIFITMVFSSTTSNILRIAMWFTLVWEIGYLLFPESRTPDRLYTALLKIGICFTSVTSFLTDKAKVLTISNKGFLIEDVDEKVKKSESGIGLIYIIICIIYNPIIPLFYKTSFWVAAHIGVLTFFSFRIWAFKKNSQ